MSKKPALTIILMLVLVGAAFTPRFLDYIWGNAPIVLYGRLIDQDGNPVQGATVTWSVLAEKRLSLPIAFTDNQVSWTVSAVSDSSGNIVIHGGRGRSLYITGVITPGYIEFHGTTDFKYGTRGTCLQPYRPDPANPEIFRLWKLRGHSHNDGASVRINAARDGRLYMIDMVKREYHEGAGGTGDLLIAITGPENVTRRQQYKWTLKIEAVDGGIAPATGLFPYEAPTEGYRPSFTYTIERTAHDGDVYDKQLHGWFYLKSRGGRVYAAMMFNLRFPDNPPIEVGYRLNSDGSRILEP